GRGTVSSNPAGIGCGATCSAAFDFGSTVTLTATPSNGSKFVRWTGDCTASALFPNVAVATMVGPRSCDAELEPVVVTVTKSGSGTVTSTPAGISCGATCSAPFVGGSVMLTATPGAGSSFDHWGGACSGTSATTSLALAHDDVTCDASFVA